MTPDPNAQQRFEELLKDDSGVVVPSSPAESDQHKLHILTAVLNKYKTVIRPPATVRSTPPDNDSSFSSVCSLSPFSRCNRSRN